ncbi:MAG TPA: PIN domain-containing protein [Thermoanaerobaculia bacterium]|nr:PIN domain-containing protein [Thermoanaerobaculia bacterium]
MAAFVDTNVAVYAHDHGSPEKRERAIQLFTTPPDQLVISTQVLSEFYWAVTRRLDPPLSVETATAAVDELAVLPVVSFDRTLVLTAVRTADRHQIALWDALIVEAAVVGGCDRLLTEDLNHGQTIRGVEIENPFRG